ncbi:hypothetical protein F444_21291 [Phytophthora nicotianae P1976]|uniref:Uncharacterized protein n=1 Tax=Phytophthora nicotianae P1976 TaxID=1317066 RepID=A0A080Z1M1_PHYNI|nr:hypothetical protein F444_21291 [Phytophthora nicotianae P1976]
MVPPTTETDFTYGDNHVFSDEELLSEEGAKLGTRTSVALKMSLLRVMNRQSPKLLSVPLEIEL